MKKNLWIVFMLLCFGLAACNLPTNQQSTPTREADAILTAAAETVAAQLTQGVTMPTPGPTLELDTSTPTVGPQETAAAPATATNTLAPAQPTQTQQVCDRGDFVEDVSIEDGTQMVPGESFTKTWRLKNSGTCTWTTSYAVVFDHDNLMGAQSVVTLPKSVAPGETVDVSVAMTAPTTPGKYVGYWMLRNEQGTVFGLGTGANKSFYVEIEVVSGEFAVTGVYPKVSPNSFTGACSPVSLTFEADIRVNKAGTISYHWIFSDADDSAVKTLDFTEAGTKTVSITLDLTADPGEHSGWGSIYIDEPNHQEFSKATYTLTCE